MQREGKDARKIPLANPLLDSAPSRHFGVTVDKPFSSSPNRSGISLRSDFGGAHILNPFSSGRPKLLGIAGPTTHGLRASTKYMSV